MNALETTRELMKKNGIIPRKRLGQNFLIEDKILSNIVELSQIGPSDIVFEIGPGLGNLTEYILDKGAEVIAFEIDTVMEKVLSERFQLNKRFQLVMKDFLNEDLQSFIRPNQKIVVIANLPYYITTPILFKLLESTKEVSRIIIMVQKEVAERISAKPGGKDYGVLSISVQYQADIEKLFDVPKTAFIPSPNVLSSVIKITPNIKKEKDYGIDSVSLFREVVKASFLARRKKLINSLEVSQIINKYNLTKEIMAKTLKACDIDSLARAEQLEIKDFIKIANQINQIKQ